MEDFFKRLEKAQERLNEKWSALAQKEGQKLFDRVKRYTPEITKVLVGNGTFAVQCIHPTKASIYAPLCRCQALSYAAEHGEHPETEYAQLCDENGWVFKTRELEAMQKFVDFIADVYDTRSLAIGDFK